MNLLISCSSYLFYSEEIWKLLEKNNNINFNEYGNLFNQKDKVYHNDIKIIFLEDIIDFYLIDNEKSLKSEKTKVDFILRNIKKDLINKNTNYIIGIASNSYNEILSVTQKKDYTTALFEYFKDEIYRLCKKNNNLFLIDLERIFLNEGLKKCFDRRNFYSFRCHLSIQGLKILLNSVNKILHRIIYSRKKLLLLDCDNTLWKGVVGEEGINGIELGNDGIGRAYYHFQKAIKKISNNGILLGLVSKNQDKDVFDVFNKHESMVLNLKDTVIQKINWSEKYLNINNISKELDLGLDSIVFWDDNPIEREKVKLHLKKVEVIEPDDDVANWSRQLLETFSLSKFQISKEDKTKTKHYKMRSKFISNKHKARDEYEYLKNIKLKPKIINISEGNIGRAEQLTQKTNQFNFTTKRYKKNEILKINKKNNSFMVNLKDIYGDHGLVSLVILEDFENYILIDSFIMSCRIIGRYLENWILNEIIKITKKKKKKVIITEFVKSERNVIAENFIKANFDILKKNELRKFNLPINKKYYLYNTKNKVKKINFYE